MADAVIGRLIYKITGDNKELRRELRKSVRDMEHTADRFKTIGRNLTLGLTVPIVGIGASMAKAAIDLNESVNAVNVIFGESADRIHAWGEAASESAGLARSEFNQAATRLGASLRNAGLDADEMADRTIELTQRAADLASVFNTDVNEALTAIQAAIRGEGEPIERFGGQLTAAAVEAKAFELGLASATSEMTESVKVQARLALIMDQTAQVAGDFANTSDQAANQTRILKAEVQNLQAELGQELLPVIKDILTELLEMVDRFQELDDEQKQQVIRWAAFLAAIGPVSGAIGNIITAVDLLRLRMLALAGNPVVLAVAGIAAVTGGLVALGRARRGAQLEEIAKEFENIGTLAGVSAEEIDAIQTALYHGGASGFQDAREQVEALAANLGLSRVAVIDIGLHSEQVSDAYKKQLRSIRDQVQEQERLEVIWEAQEEDLRELRNLQMERERSTLQESIAQAEITRELERQRTLDEMKKETVDDYESTVIGVLRSRRDALDLEIQQYQQALDNQVLTEETRMQTEAIVASYRTELEVIKEQIRAEEIKLGLREEETDQAEETTNKLDEQLRRSKDQRKLDKERLVDQGVEQEGLSKKTRELYEQKKLLEEQSSLSRDLERIATEGYGAAFEALGKDIAEANAGFEALKEAAKDVVIATLRALAEEALVRAAIALAGGNVAGAIGYGVAATGAYASAGVVSALGQGGQFYADEPRLIMVGDRPEYVDIRPVDHVAPPGTAPSGGTTVIIQGDVLDANRLVEKLDEYDRRARRAGRK